MASTYSNSLRIELIATGEAAATWGEKTNVNLTNIAAAFGYATQDGFAANADSTTTVADGAADPARAMYFKVTSSATLTATRTLTIAPNTISRVMWIENATAGGQSIQISQGTGANVTIATGKTAVVYLDGAGSGAAVVDAMAGVSSGASDTLAEILASGNATGGTDIAVGTGDDITFADSSKAIFGAGSDLSIYSDGSTGKIDGNVDVTGSVTADDAVIQSDGATVTVSSADYEVALLGRRGSSGVDLDKGFFRLKDTGTTKVAIDTAGNSYFNGGNVGIGTDSPAQALVVKRSSGDTYLDIARDTQAQGQVALQLSGGTGGTSWIMYQDASSNDLRFYGNSSNRMVLDSGGKLLVGKTASDYAVEGVEIRSNEVLITKSTTNPLNVRNGQDGGLIAFASGSNTVGSIGTEGGDLTIGSSASGHKGVRFGANYIAPINTSNAFEDNTTDLGLPAVRFKDLYLSGDITSSRFSTDGDGIKMEAGKGIKFSGYASGNVLDDYEEGTWTPQVNFGGSDNGVTYGTRTGRYTKIGRMVYLSFNILLSSKGSQTGQVTISGAPFGNYAGSQNNASPIICEGNGSSFPDAFGMMWNDNQIYVRYQGANTKLPVYESNFTNSTQIFGMMQYET